MKKYAYILAALLIAAVGAYFLFSASSQNTPSKTAPSEVVAIGYSRLSISLPVFVAQEKGFFQKHGIKADLKMYETAQPLMQALVQGQIDVAGYTALPITYNGMQRSGKKLYFSGLMIEDQDHRISYLLKRKGASNISGISDLRGKTVGILPTVAYKAWLEAMLKAEGVPVESVKIQQIAPTLQAQALKSGGVDALFTNDPVATASIRNGVAELATSEVSVPKYLGEPFVFGSFNISKEWADANPELSKRIVAALDEAIAYINANPDAAKEAMKPYLAEAFREDVAAYPAARYLSSKDTTDALLQQAADLYLKIGIIPEPLKLSDVVLK